MRLLSKTSIWMALREGFASFCSDSRAALLPRFWRHSSMTHGCLEHDRRSVVSHLRHSLVFFLTSRQGHGHNNNGFSSLTMFRVNSSKAIYMQMHAPLTTFPASNWTSVLWNRTATSDFLRFFWSITIKMLSGLSASTMRPHAQLQPLVLMTDLCRRQHHGSTGCRLATAWLW